MPSGYCGKNLIVDLTTGDTSIEEPSAAYYRMHLGGWSVIADTLLRRAPRGVDPLAPGNPLVFATGVVTGSPVPGSGRHAVGAKSPLTGGFGEADVGGFWGTELKRAGFDAVIIVGAASAPTYLWVHDGEVELRDASSLWGRSTADVEQAIRSELDDAKVRVAQCGIAGENLVRYACVMHDVNRAAGRTGLGAVMGSKKLKAVAVRGTGAIEVGDRDKATAMSRFVGSIRERWAGFHEHGTGGGMLHMQEVGRLPTRNFRDGRFDGVEKIAGTTLTERYLVKRDTCHACPIGCKRIVETHDEYTVDPVYGGPEYETLAALGSTCEVNHLEAICYANQLCNAYGLDTISAGVSIAWAMECFDRGLLTVQDTDGLDIRFGDHQVMVTLVEQIARREGFGDLLAEGSLRAARAIGRDTEQYAVQIKGQELPMHDSRYQFSLAVGYATSPTGADHMHNFHDASLGSEAGVRRFETLGIFSDPIDRIGLPPMKTVISAAAIQLQVMQNCAGICMFEPYSTAQFPDIVAAATGWDVSIDELRTVGKRALALSRLYNALEGLTPADDTHPQRFSEPLGLGNGETSPGVPGEDLAAALTLYYELQGWDRTTGAPTSSTLHALSVGWAADLLAQIDTAG